MKDIDDDVIRRAQGNDSAAFEMIYRHYAGMVYRVAIRVTRNVEDAQEVTQQVFLAAHRHLGNFAGKSSLKTWLYRITMNCSLNAIKGKRQHEVAWEEGFDPQDTRDDLRENIAKEARLDEISRLLGNLSADHRACLVLRAQEGLSYEQIAHALNINLNTVRSRLKRARQTLVDLNEEKRGGL